MRLVCFVFIVVVIITGCKNDPPDPNKTYQKFYYDNGVIMKEGYFDKQARPVDTLKSYSVDGKLKWLEVYDTSSHLNGLSLLYYPNGVVEQKKSYHNNVLNGEVFNYYESGKLKSVGYAAGGLLQGDRYHYYENGNYKAYNFLDFSEHNAMVHLFDSASKERVDRKGDHLVIDSVLFQGDSIQLEFLLAHPPYSVNEIQLVKMGADNKPVQTMAIPDSARHFKINLLKDPSFKSLILSVAQFDSITGKKLISTTGMIFMNK
ncbi:hypothetical protein [Paraflavitalea speifideaquila]|uniref:toxin-antitoxin system YwqK family antitoxin n=1 Tax=Paraflavitalea speifideaquila TaxID=3076558 RepID=UPI0028E70432|nr:hypothetical protein [Paraflavitalea speifideiaquila]